MKKILISLATLVSLCLLIILLNFTTPVSAGPFGVLAIFLFAYISCLGVVTILIYFASRLFAHLSGLFMSRKPLDSLSFRRSYYFSTVLSSIPIMLIGLQSVGKVGFYEYLLVFIFAFIGCLYIYKKIS